jgi:signal transduction histidine kinase
MQKRMIRNWQPGNRFYSVLVLLLLFFFTYVFGFEVPFAGFYFNPTNGEVHEVYVETGLLQTGDRIERVGEVPFSAYVNDSTLSLFEGIGPGDTVDISIIRKGEALTISWMFPGFNRNEFRARLFNVWWLAYFFWALGSAIQISMRPRDARRRLLVAANFLTALWLVVGCISSSHTWGCAVLLRVLTWLMLPVYLNLHWDFPRPLADMPKAVWIGLYAIGGALAASELVQFPPRPLYAFGFLLALLGSVLLLFLHFFIQPARKRDVGLLLTAMLIGVAPSIVLAIFAASGNIPEIGPWAFLALPIMPGAYYYVIYRRQLGEAEIRANRIITIYSYLILVGIVLLLLISPAATMSLPPETMIFFTFAVSLITAVVSILLFPAFQSFVEQRFLGVKLPYQNIQEIYSARITTSTSLHDLLALLKEEVFPSLLIRQYMFLQLDEGSPKVLLASGVTGKPPAAKDELSDLEALAGKSRFAEEGDKKDEPYSWVRLPLPLGIGEELIGLWLLGRRDPDDIYPQAEIPILQSLANQTAIALSNILQADRLRTLYQKNIDRHEQERMRLARDLHDGVLNEMAVLSLNLDPSPDSPKFKEAYDGLVQRLREIVSDLRPPMLQYGLKPALEELGEGLMERGKDRVIVEVDVQGGENRLPPNVELHLFRIAQEASENALRHGHPRKIEISGRLDPEKIQLTIEDDGDGFEAGKNPDLNSLYLNRHFGLIGMVERANLIGAELSIASAPRAGTRVSIVWEPNQSETQT